MKKCFQSCRQCVKLWFKWKTMMSYAFGFIMLLSTACFSWICLPDFPTKLEYNDSKKWVCVWGGTCIPKVITQPKPFRMGKPTTFITVHLHQNGGGGGPKSNFWTALIWMLLMFQWCTLVSHTKLFHSALLLPEFSGQIQCFLRIVTFNLKYFKFSVCIFVVYVGRGTEDQTQLCAGYASTLLLV